MTTIHPVAPDATASGPPAVPAAASGSADAQTPARPAGLDTAAPAELTAAAAVAIPLTLVRRVGAEAAVTWALLQRLGTYDRQRLARAMGIPVMDVRIHYAHLARLGLLPEGFKDHPAAGSAATHEPERETAGEKEYQQ